MYIQHFFTPQQQRSMTRDHFTYYIIFDNRIPLSRGSCTAAAAVYAWNMKRVPPLYECFFIQRAVGKEPKQQQYLFAPTINRGDIRHRRSSTAVVVSTPKILVLHAQTTSVHKLFSTRRRSPLPPFFQTTTSLRHRVSLSTPPVV